MTIVPALKDRFLKVASALETKYKVVVQVHAQWGETVKEIEEAQLTGKKVKEVLLRLTELAKRGAITQVEELGTYALQTVLDEPSYKFSIVPKEFRGGVIYVFMYEHFGQEPVKLSAAGGGVKDLISTFLAIIIPIVLDPSARRFVVLDERFKHLSAKYLPRVAKVIKFLSDRLGIQFFIVTQREQLREAADVLYFLSNTAGEASVKKYRKGYDD